MPLSGGSCRQLSNDAALAVCNTSASCKLGLIQWLYLRCRSSSCANQMGRASLSWKTYLWYAASMMSLRARPRSIFLARARISALACAQDTQSSKLLSTHRSDVASLRIKRRRGSSLSPRRVHCLVGNV